MVEIRNNKDLEKWLDGKPAEHTLPVANRALLRGIPTLATDIVNTELYHNWKNRFILPMMRSSIVSLAKAKNFDKWVLLAESIAAHEFAANSHDLVPEYNEALKAILRSFSDLADSSVFNPTLRNRYVSVFYFLSSVEYSQHSFEFDLLSAISLDATALEAGVDLWSQPLWLDDTPEWAIRGWETLATELTRRAPYWRTLVRWYEDRLHGDDWAAAQGRPAIPELEIARASLPDSYWKKGGKAVNQAIAKLEDYFWTGVEIDDPVLKELVRQSTDPTDYIERSEVSDLLTGRIEAEEAISSPPITPPALPPQAHGPHFGLRDGLLDFAPPDHLDPARNNVQRLRSLVPLLRAEAVSAIEIFGRNKAHGRIHDALVMYSGLLQGDVTALNYDLIAGFGVKLQSEEAAAKEAIAEGLEPAFERSETAALKSVLDLHGPVVLSTEAGQTFVADAEQWKRNPREEKAFRQSAVALAEAIEDEKIATPDTTAFVKQAAGDIGLGPQPERSAVFGVSAIRNVSIALIGGAVLYHPAQILLQSGLLQSAATVTGTAIAGAAGGVAGALFNEGIKKSKRGLAVSDRVRSTTDAVFDRQTYKKINDFVRNRWHELKDVSGQSREFKWLRDWLDWLKAHPPE